MNFDTCSAVWIIDGTRTVGFSIFFPIHPKPYSRPRPRKKASTGKKYFNPRQQTIDDIKKLVQWRIANRYQFEFEDGVFVRSVVWIPKPRTSKFDRPVGRGHGDLDNYVKTVLDGLVSVIPDELIIDHFSSKRWGDPGKGWPGYGALVKVVSADAVYEWFGREQFRRPDELFRGELESMLHFI